MKFYVGIHMPNWIPRMQIPFMVSRRILEKRKKLPRANVGYALDSGGFTELSKYGKWSQTPQQYTDIVHRIVDGVGRKPDFIAPQDSMCEPFICQKTKRTVEQHMVDTVENFILLRQLVDTSLYVLPVIQGYTLNEYLQCIYLYEQYGIVLSQYPIVGLGSICRRQKTKEGINIIQTIASMGISLHGFGLKTTALKEVSTNIASADSMAWSFAGRRIPNPSGKTKNLANDYGYMMKWYNTLKDSCEGLNEEICC